MHRLDERPVGARVGRLRTAACEGSAITETTPGTSKRRSLRLEARKHLDAADGDARRLERRGVCNPRPVTARSRWRRKAGMRCSASASVSASSPPSVASGCVTLMARRRRCRPCARAAISVRLPAGRLPARPPPKRPRPAARASRLGHAAAHAVAEAHGAGLGIELVAGASRAAPGSALIAPGRRRGSRLVAAARLLHLDCSVAGSTEPAAAGRPGRPRRSRRPARGRQRLALVDLHGVDADPGERQAIDLLPARGRSRSQATKRAARSRRRAAAADRRRRRRIVADVVRGRPDERLVGQRQPQHARARSGRAVCRRRRRSSVR